MTAEESWASAMRAEALAKLLLTQREDVEVFQVSQTSPRVGYDLLVRMHDKGSSPAPEFAVEVKGTRADLVTATLTRIFREVSVRIRDVDLPLCLFVFQVDRREGCYRWLYEPVIRGPDRAELVKTLDPSDQEIERGCNPAEVPQSAGFAKLDGKSIDLIVDQVVRWSRLRGRVLVR